MRKILVGAAALLLLVSCQKEPIMVRNYSYPMDKTNLLGTCGGSNIAVEEGWSDDYTMQRIREQMGFDTINYPVLFLDAYTYDLNSDDTKQINNPDPDYLKFPHSINSMRDKWGWDYYYEYMEIGEEAFCDKYLNGELTIGMKLD